MIVKLGGCNCGGRVLNGYSGPAELVGGEAAAMSAEADSSAARSIGIGVATGTLIWAATRALDAIFGKRSK